MKPSLKNRVAAGLALLAGVLFADVPQWWVDREIVDTNLVANDYAPVIQGQAKHAAMQAYLEFDERLGGADASISNMIAGFSATNNYLPLNIGQLKNMATPFYDQLAGRSLTAAWPVGMTIGPYPWSRLSSATNDFAIANIGQLKYIFSFDPYLVLDSDGDGLPDWWESENGLDPAANDDANGAAGDPDNDGLANIDEFAEQTDPTYFDTDGDLLADGAEISYYQTDPRFPDSDADGVDDGLDKLSISGSETLSLGLAFSPFRRVLYGVIEGVAYEFYFTRDLNDGFVVGDANLIADGSGALHWYNTFVE